MAFGQKKSHSFHGGFLSNQHPDRNLNRAPRRAQYGIPANAGGFASLAQGCLPLSAGLPSHGESKKPGGTALTTPKTLLIQSARKSFCLYFWIFTKY
jgi:hypothetical protein